MTKLEQVVPAMCERAGTNWSDTSGDETSLPDLSDTIRAVSATDRASLE